MKPNPSVSSSDLERARETAARLVDAVPGTPASVPVKPGEYVRFDARSLGVSMPASRPAPPPAPPRPASPPPRPRAPFLEDHDGPALAEEPRAAEPRPVPRPEPPPPAAALRAAAPVRPVPPPLPPEPAPPEPPAPTSDPLFDMDENTVLAEAAAAAAAAADETLGVVDDVPEPSVGAAPAAFLGEGSIDFDDDIATAAAAAVGLDVDAPESEPAPTWADILDDAIYLAKARCALVMDGTGLVHESRGDWPKNTLEKVAARLLRGIEQAKPPQSPDAGQLIEIQLGSFWLTGIRVPLGGRPAVVGFLSQAPVAREIRPGLEAEIRRGLPL